MFEYSSDKDIVFVDIEANMKPRRLVQFGAIKMKTDGTIETFNIFSNPKCKLSDHIQKMLANNLDNIKKGQDNTKSVKKIWKILENCTLVSFGNFDYEFLNFLSKKLLNKELKVDFIDMQEKWKELSCSTNNTSLTDLAKLFGVEYDETKLHDGLYDAQILFQIFQNWKQTSDQDVLNIIYKNRIRYETQTKLRQNKENKNSKTINNLNNTNGIVFMDLSFSKIKKDPEKYLTNISLLEIQNETIKRNWNFFYDIKDKMFNQEEYAEKLINSLKQYVISSRNKKIIIKEKQYHDLIRLNNLCSKYLGVYPINKLSYSNGFENLFQNISFDDFKFYSNLYLIKTWLVFRYLENS